MADQEEFYKDIIDNLYDGIYFVDRQRVITYWNKGAERITGYHAETVLGHSCSENLLNHVTANGIQLCRNGCPLSACMQDGNVREAEVFLHHADGHRLPVLVRASPIRDKEGNIIGAVETFSDNTGMMSIRQQLGDLNHANFVDALTEIGNRKYFESRMRAVVAGSTHYAGNLGLLFLDVDHFKAVNDTYGHDVGDRVLRMIAATLHHNLRAGDVVCRWGGEEFAVILENAPSLKVVRAIAEKCRILVEFSRLDLAEKSLSVTISVGGTLLLPDDTLESLVRRADELMYQSKREGRNRVTVG